MNSNLLESNERTLVIFDSVCVGLAECLALVHADIRQMTEHRNQLAFIEQERLQAKLVDPEQQQQHHLSDGSHTLTESMNGTSELAATKIQRLTRPRTTDLDASEWASSKVDDEDPHNLARLKLLDKRLADSFNQALNMCDQQKTSLNAKKQHYSQSISSANGGSDMSRPASHHRPSIFQVLLGKTGSGGGGGGGQKHQMAGDSLKRSKGEVAKGKKEGQPAMGEPDNRLVIDDINRQTRLAMQYSKQLEAHLFKVEDLRTRYEMHLKMGLVVRSVSRAYSNTSGSSVNSSSSHNSPNSLGRRRPDHFISSLMVNDSSSLGTTAHSSLSSLNLSTWSFSRRVHRDERARNDSSCPPNSYCPVHYDDNSLRRSHDEQRYVSTISLDSLSRRNNRSSLTKLISNPSTKQQQPPAHYLGPPDKCEPYEQAPGRVNGPCQCHRLLNQDSSLPYINIEPPAPPPLPVPRQAVAKSDCLSQYTYADVVTPTATGTLLGSSGGAAPDERSLTSSVKNNYNYNRSHTTNGSNLHKSASHSSLKDKGKRTKANQQATLGAGAMAKTTIKEFIENIERIESEFESYMGSFLLNIEDIQGFARVCQGDVFEISIKYGSAQKFKCKISVLRDSRQKCDNRQSVFKARIADVIAIKAYECKGLGKRVLLGHKLCETRDLFTARSQLMTISLNQTGSIKLNLVITWNPLHMAPSASLALPPGLDIAAHISLPPTPVSSSTLSSLSSGQSFANGNCPIGSATSNRANTTTTINIQSSNCMANGKSSKVEGRTRLALNQTQQASGSNVAGKANLVNTHTHRGQRQQQSKQVHSRQHQYEQMLCNEHQRDLLHEQHAKLFPEVDPTYDYYIPEPDYQANDIRR